MIQQGEYRECLQLQDFKYSTMETGLKKSMIMDGMNFSFETKHWLKLKEAHSAEVFVSVRAPTIITLLCFKFT